MDEYTKGFEALKGMRTLRWKPHLGLVDLDVELADRTLSLSVTPAQATAIMHFQDKGTSQRKCVTLFSLLKSLRSIGLSLLI